MIDENVELTEFEKSWLDDDGGYELNPMQFPGKNASKEEIEKWSDHNELVIRNLKLFIETKQFTLKNGINGDELKKKLKMLSSNHDYQFVLFEKNNKTIVYIPRRLPKEGPLNELFEKYEIMLEFPLDATTSLKSVKAFAMIENEHKLSADVLIYLYKNYTDDELESVLAFYDYLWIDAPEYLINTFQFWKEDREKAWVEHDNGVINFFIQGYNKENKVVIVPPLYKNKFV